MQYEVTTKQGTNFIVDDGEVSFWLEFEEAFEETFHEAQELISKGSITIMTKVLFTGAKLGNHTELKTWKKWVEVEFERFDVVGEPNPKAEEEHLEGI